MVPRLDRSGLIIFTNAPVISDEEAQRPHDGNLPIPVFKTQNKLAADLEPSGILAPPTRRVKSPRHWQPEEFIAERAPTLIGHFLRVICQPIRVADQSSLYGTPADLASIEGDWTLNGRRNDPETLDGL
ncbi:uncharacterized protein ATNIH1004_001988 [Aspergillus tanneri]|uniref:Uncharacterized protein n=1 Tax=Aspergillus tanneri TaxID=1220188 RepID=A0A5M9M762_9EURO|nr:uncharacterized protein ATNIH1004_001988 [Aspergillus tanneri]KAA8641320.1 hypothetical protein ATNIH1004_001988 [Aspergillus tanneri]